MSQTRERREYPPGVPCWVDLEVADLEAAKRFYGGLFGWAFEDALSDGSYLVARLEGDEVAGIGQPTPGAASALSWNTYVRVDDVDAALEQVRKAGGSVVDASDRLSRLARVATFTDPVGAPLRLWQPRSLPGVQRANEAGTWNMNELSASDPDAARAFYAAVFGWEFNQLAFGGESSWMVRMPGYGDFLAGYEPGIRDRQAEAGVPEGFADAIAWLSGRAGDAVQDTQRWGIIFAITDPDATARGAVELGGTVVNAPTDVGPDVRLAVLADPSGAPFTVSRYAPAFDG